MMMLKGRFPLEVELLQVKMLQTIQVLVPTVEKLVIFTQYLCTGIVFFAFLPYIKDSCIQLQANFTFNDSILQSLHH